MNKGTLIYSATTFKDGLGGHYRSLLSIASASKKFGYDVCVINFGKTENKLFITSEIPIINIDISESEREILLHLRSLSILSDYYTIHCFDTGSFYYLSKVSKRIILTKCGGRNPRYFYPYSRYLTVFSEEDYVFFNKNKRYSSSCIKMISNRVESFDVDYEKIDLLRNRMRIQPDDFVILKISRITNYYFEHLKQAVELKKAVKRDNVKLLIVGAAHELDVFDKLNRIAGDNKDITIITEDYFTKNAKDILGICNLYIGSGRSLMEATSLGLPVATHVSNGNIPVLVDTENYLEFLRTNFSGRSQHFSNDATRINTIVDII